MSKKARTAAPKAASGPAPAPTRTSAPTTARSPEASPASKPASRPIRKARIDVDQATGSAPTRRIKTDSKPSKKVMPVASRDTKPAGVHEVKPAVLHESKAAATQRGKGKSSGGLSALDAAAQVLAGLSRAESREGITAHDLIERMAKTKLWTSPGGKTPAATLYAAMIREITKKGAASRFKRIAPGRFAASSASRVKPATPAKPAKSRAEVAA